MSELRNCMFICYCMETYCDMSCPKNAVSDILVSKSHISYTDDVFSVGAAEKVERSNFLKEHEGQIVSLSVDHTNQVAKLLTFVAICDHCEGYGISVTAYHLNYSKYINDLKDSWSHGVGLSLQEKIAHINHCKILIISGIDYMSFNDFESQTMLNLLQDRDSEDRTTIIVAKDIDSLAGKGTFFSALKSMLKEVSCK